MADNHILTEEEKLARQRNAYHGYTLRELPRLPYAVRYRGDPRAKYFNQVIPVVQQLIRRSRAA